MIDALIELLFWGLHSAWVLAGLVLGLLASYFVWQWMPEDTERAVLSALVLVVFVVGGFVAEWFSEERKTREARMKEHQ